MDSMTLIKILHASNQLKQSHTHTLSGGRKYTKRNGKEKKREKTAKQQKNAGQNKLCVDANSQSIYINKVSMDFVNKMKLTLANTVSYWWKYWWESFKA